MRTEKVRLISSRVGNRGGSFAMQTLRHLSPHLGSLKQKQKECLMLLGGSVTVLIDIRLFSTWARAIYWAGFLKRVPISQNCDSVSLKVKDHATVWDHFFHSDPCVSCTPYIQYIPNASSDVLADVLLFISTSLVKPKKKKRLNIFSGWLNLGAKFGKSCYYHSWKEK